MNLKLTTRFSLPFLNSQGEIRATGFNQAVDNLYETLQEGKVYLISKARVNIAKKQFTNLTNEYEIMFENSTEVQLVRPFFSPSSTPVADARSWRGYGVRKQVEDDQDVPKVKFELIQLADLSTLEKDAICDVMGVVLSNGDVTEITAKATQKQIKKREIVLADQSQYQVRVTLWGRQAETWSEQEGGIVALKGVKVGDFGGRTLSVSGSSTLVVDPDIEEAHSLRGWCVSPLLSPLLPFVGVEKDETDFSSLSSNSKVRHPRRQPILRVLLLLRRRCLRWTNRQIRRLQNPPSSRRREPGHVGETRFLRDEGDDHLRQGGQPQLPGLPDGEV
jgi:hypothetical protein